jgi:hypothetical protein
MRSAQYTLAAALTLGLAGTVSAQTTQPAPTTATTQTTTYGESPNHWIASGFVGSGFHTHGEDPRIEQDNNSISYGGQVGWLWRGIVGPEFLVEWAPNSQVNSVFIDGDTHVHSYMANVIASMPLGADGQVQPFISGGYGHIAMTADFVAGDGGTSNNTSGRWGSNIGGGVMAFANKFGVRGDLRYYHASSANEFSGSAADQFVESLVSGLHFWRATGGVSVRW